MGDKYREHRASPWPVPPCFLLFTRGAAPVVEIPLQLSNAGRRCWCPHPDRSLDLACFPLPLHLRTPPSGSPSAIAWMDIATTADLYDGAPMMVWCWDIPRLPGTMDREGHRAEEGNVALLGIVTQARIQRLPLMAGGKPVDLVVQRNQASEPLLTPSSIAPRMK
ncbi:MAG: hypothetical protein JSR64_05970 [Nitrospira sp.]|nr:hypothetical protein [Nitrospira sp.]MBS0173565.1 hypothetical protein [Nitrospira sp.]MBX3336943.1 hypothetical protein [Nitrospira sp.]MCW5779508.1 hypothetical protein [Nitrospira sp.]HMZ56014.1 hypothetical protein [Nitrospira sp.]